MFTLYNLYKCFDLCVIDSVLMLHTIHHLLLSCDAKKTPNEVMGTGSPRTFAQDCLAAAQLMN